MPPQFIKVIFQNRYRHNCYSLYHSLTVNLRRILISIIIAFHSQTQANPETFEPIMQMLAHSLNHGVTLEQIEVLNSEVQTNFNTEPASLNGIINIAVNDTDQDEYLDAEMIQLENKQNLLIEEDLFEVNEQLLEDTHQDKNTVQMDEITDNHYLIELGVNFLLPISLNHLNRIETPFIQPEIKTSSEAVIEIEGNVLYVLVNHNEPVSLFITESNQPHQAISLTLIAKRIPPRTVTLEMANLDDTRHKRWITHSKEAQSKDYISNLKTVLTAVARNELPSGYTQRRTQLAQHLVTCYQAGIDHGLSDAITLIGEEFIIYITKVTNRTQDLIALNEASCKGELITAISFFPHQKLLPGQFTEMFLVTNRAKQ